MKLRTKHARAKMFRVPSIVRSLTWAALTLVAALWVIMGTPQTASASAGTGLHHRAAISGLGSSASPPGIGVTLDAIAEDDSDDPPDETPSDMLSAVCTIPADAFPSNDESKLDPLVTQKLAPKPGYTEPLDRPP